MAANGSIFPNNKRQPEKSVSCYTQAGDDVPTVTFDEPVKKPKLSKKGKTRFVCRYAGCGRSYSRAEHLARHQLNHAPKGIFKCGFPGCPREFVRQDLCIRHRERHSDQVADDAGGDAATIDQGSRSESLDLNEPIQRQIAGGLLTNAQKAIGSQDRSTSIAHRSHFGSGDTRLELNTNVEFPQMLEPMSYRQPSFLDSHVPTEHTAVAVTDDGTAGLDCAIISPSMNLDENSRADSYGRDALTVGVSQNAISSQGPRHSLQSLSSFNQIEQIVPMPINLPQPDDLFSNSSGTSPSRIGGNFAAWLFNDMMDSPNGVFGITNENPVDMAGFWDAMDVQDSGDIATRQTNNVELAACMSRADQSLLEQSLQRSSRNTLLSEARRDLLIDIVEHTFGDEARSAIGVSKDELLRENRSSEDHVLSMRSMELFIGSYWYHFHIHLPILHKPTFSADAVNPYLLLAIMTVGASCLDKIHGTAFINSSAKLSNFIAWHLRWRIFSDMDCQPPAKLWVFQTLLLLEVYEKMTATRSLHERSHIHFATTLTLMRRGSSLVEATEMSVPASPLPDNDPLDDAPRSLPAKLDEWWKKWITTESTRRVAFAAFIIDSTHATMFGHTANMVVHEICLPLPCDETLWSATSSAEVGRIESILHANAVKPITFLDGLKKILNRGSVRTNPFGRMILMAGLLSVAWHMRQNELQKTLFASKQIAGAPIDQWQDAMANAFDFWKRDFDDSLAHMRNIPQWQRSDNGGVNEDSTYEAAGFVLHHLSHIAMHINIKDCQIFAGASRLLGRVVTKADLTTVHRRMKLWAPTKGARIAVFYAINYVKYVMFPENDFSRFPDYTAQDDPLFNRPWVLYYAVLVIWCYGYCLDGPLQPFPQGLSHAVDHAYLPSESNILLDNARSYLSSMGMLQKPELLANVTQDRNNVIGVLALVRNAFQGSKWELLHEASTRLTWTIALLRRE